MKNAWFDVRFAHAVVRQLVYRGMFRTGFTEGARSSVVDLGCLDAPQFVPTGYCKVGTLGEPTCGFEHRFTAWEFGRENRECVEQFAEYHGEELLFLVYRLGVLNKCRQYAFNSLPALLKWAQRAPDGRGRTFYVGRRENGKLLRVYEKGKQLGAENSPWVRIELELHNKDSGRVAGCCIF